MLFSENHLYLDNTRMKLHHFSCGKFLGVGIYNPWCHPAPHLGILKITSTSLMPPKNTSIPLLQHGGIHSLNLFQQIVIIIPLYCLLRTFTLMLQIISF